AHLQLQERQDAVPGTAPGDGSAPAAALATRTELVKEEPPARRLFYLRAATFLRGAAVFFAAAFLPPDAATDARSASIRSTTGVSATGSGASSISRPSSFASSISFSEARYSDRSSAGSNG